MKAYGIRKKLLLLAITSCVIGVLVRAALVAGSPEAETRPLTLGAVEWVGVIRNAGDVKGKSSWAKRFLKAVIGLDEQQRSMLMPNGVNVDPQGRILVADTRQRVVHVFDPARRRYQALRPPSSDPFLAPIAVGTDSAGRIYVSDSVQSRVFTFSREGKFRGTLGGLGRRESIFKRATGLAVDRRRDLLYVVDTLAMRVVVMTFDGKVHRRFGRRGLGPAEFNYPTHIAVAPDSTLWVTDSLNFRVQHLDSEGKFLSAFGRAGSDIGDFDKAKGIAVDSEGRVYVVEGRNDRVQVYDFQGRLLHVFGTTGVGQGQFFLPSGITLDNEGRIYVADSYNGRVQIFRPQVIGTPLPGGN